jgi:uncharacterized protein with HEPN domain
MNKDNTIYLEHILNSIHKIQEYTASISENDFQNNTMIQDAVIRQFEIIGEATKQISADYKAKYNTVPWKEMAGMRDKLIHNYIDVDLGVIWQTVKKDIPFLHKLILACQ